jgi:thioredoxin reductase (NADPH)
MPTLNLGKEVLFMSDSRLTPEIITLYGTGWCPDCKRSKQFFGEQRVPYHYVDIDNDPDATTFVEEVNKGFRSIPTIVFPDGSVLVEPSNAQLAEKLRLQTRAKRAFYDAIIIGGGPTGLTAATYLAREGAETLVIEKAGLGGQAGITQTLDNFPGFDEGISGADFAARLTWQAQRFGAEILQAQDVVSIEQDGQYLCVHTADGSEYGTTSVLLATGARYRRLGIPGEDELIGSNVHFCATLRLTFLKVILNVSHLVGDVSKANHWTSFGLSKGIEGRCLHLHTKNAFRTAVGDSHLGFSKRSICCPGCA